MRSSGSLVNVFGIRPARQDTASADAMKIRQGRAICRTVVVVDLPARTPSRPLGTSGHVLACLRAPATLHGRTYARFGPRGRLSAAGLRRVSRPARASEAAGLLGSVPGGAEPAAAGGSPTEPG